MRAPVRVAVVGVGDFGVRHAHIAAALAEYELVAVVDLDAARAREVAAGLGVAAATDWHDVLDRVDALVIATPEDAHVECAETAARAGVHSLIEKPVDLDPARCRALATTAAETGTVILPGHVSRFLPEFAELRRAVRCERVLAAHARRVVPRARLDLHGRHHPAYVAMVHDLDLVRALCPGDLGEVVARSANREPSRPHPQSVWATLAFADGVTATVENHWTQPHERQYIDSELVVVTGSRQLRLKLPSDALTISDAAGDWRPDTRLDGTVGGVPTGALATEHRHFAACVREGRQSEVVSLDDAAWAVEVAGRIAAADR
ncbi:Gfo/Idh/MocA family protein [Saccharothrix obliqua]|uniref:Gfo/Idh/MocA family protein n=1 Tax=Saccharothrix obliqua TaxID=2861747 RepID=UPI001C5FF015|nr:Gfo/Idh/MocA family oxidoreductase [Saccharothrix obliqua]MBW4721385.1 Gfo/Idh/MocA family oxidoreductase [Saccharothrix obliqua]